MNRSNKKLEELLDIFDNCYEAVCDGLFDIEVNEDKDALPSLCIELRRATEALHAAVGDLLQHTASPSARPLLVQWLPSPVDKKHRLTPPAGRED